MTKVHRQSFTDQLQHSTTRKMAGFWGTKALRLAHGWYHVPMRERIVHLTKKDFIRQTFRAGGKGGHLMTLLAKLDGHPPNSATD